MSHRVLRRARAREDLLECAAHLELAAGHHVAERFLRAAERSIAQLASSPLMGWPRNSSHPRLAGIRTWRIEDFENHLVFYRPSQDTLLILRVLRGSRDLPSLLRLVDPED